MSVEMLVLLLAVFAAACDRFAAAVRELRRAKVTAARAPSGTTGPLKRVKREGKIPKPPRPIDP